MRKYVLGIVGIVGAVLTWQLLYVGPLRDTPLPAPTETAQAALALLASGAFWSALWVTIEIAVVGFVAAAIVGIIIGLLCGWYPTIGNAFKIIVEFLKPIPPIVILPLAILVFGPTEEMGRFLVFYGCVLPILYQTTNGVRETDPIAIETSRSYGIPQYDILLRVVLPSTSAFIATAIRIAIPVSLIVTVVAGLVGGGPGLGQLIQQSSQSTASASTLYALVILLGLVGLAAQLLSEKVENAVLHWHPSHRKVAN